MDEQLRVDSDLWLRFEGVMRVSHVYVNKRYMKTYSDGYTPFTVDLSGFLSQSSAKTLEIVVAVDSAADTSWWYDGGGIYRHVNMFPEQFSRLNGGGGDPGQAGRQAKP